MCGVLSLLPGAPARITGENLNPQLVPPSPGGLGMSGRTHRGASSRRTCQRGGRTFGPGLSRSCFTAEPALSVLKQSSSWLSDMEVLLQLQPEPFLLHFNRPSPLALGGHLSPHIPAPRGPAHGVLWALTRWLPCPACPGCLNCWQFLPGGRPCTRAVAPTPCLQPCTRPALGTDHQGVTAWQDFTPSLSSLLSAWPHPGLVSWEKSYRQH